MKKKQTKPKTIRAWAVFQGKIPVFFSFAGGDTYLVFKTRLEAIASSMEGETVKRVEIRVVGK